MCSGLKSAAGCSSVLFRNRNFLVSCLRRGRCLQAAARPIFVPVPLPFRRRLLSPTPRCGDDLPTSRTADFYVVASAPCGTGMRSGRTRWWAPSTASLRKYRTGQPGGDAGRPPREEPAGEGNRRLHRSISAIRCTVHLLTFAKLGSARYGASSVYCSSSRFAPPLGLVVCEVACGLLR